MLFRSYRTYTVTDPETGEVQIIRESYEVEVPYNFYILNINLSSQSPVACKNASLPKEELGLADADKVSPGEYEPTCNPIGQAQALARAGTELNVLLGLCVGHDSLFMKYSVAPVTVLAAKDRVLGHNPLAAIYLADGYYHDRLFPTGQDAAAAGDDAATGDDAAAGERDA